VEGSIRLSEATARGMSLKIPWLPKGNSAHHYRLEYGHMAKEKAYERMRE
jgi:hypothetical protein